jgi:hypothetical protein
MQKYRNVQVIGPGKYKGEFAFNEEDAQAGRWYNFTGSRNLLRITTAMDVAPEAIAEIWAEQDGFGYGADVGFDWSGIRDSSPAQKAVMDEIAKKYVTDEALDALLGLKGGT